MEMMYQYMWRHSLFGKEVRTVEGDVVKIFHPGVLNNDAGPDFSGARISIGGQEWIGNVEIHVKASDWYRHGHQHDRSYDNVILHVVAVNDSAIDAPTGRRIPQVVVTFPETLYSMYARLASKAGDVKCSGLLEGIPPLLVTDWVESLSVERMQMKASRILDMNRNLQTDWEQTAFIMLARSLGFGVNSEPFERTARSLPLKYIYRHADNPVQVEALLFGQAGMLDMSVNIFNEYYQTLCREYYFLARKYSLRPCGGSMWKYARMRPGNFPHRRLALLAQICCSQEKLMSMILDNARNPEEFVKLFRRDLSPYWQQYSSFSAEITTTAGMMTRGSTDLLLINFMAPMLYAYSAFTGDFELGETAFSIWEHLDAENNTFIRQWRHEGLPCHSAAHSQALLQLRKQYCDMGKCLECRFGHLLLRSTFRTSEYV